MVFKARPKVTESLDVCCAELWSLLALFGRDRRVGECLLLREEQKSGLRGPISESDPKRDFAPERPVATALCSHACGRPRFDRGWIAPDLAFPHSVGVIFVPRFRRCSSPLTCHPIARFARCQSRRVVLRTVKLCFKGRLCR
jgi:hypothetical protein